MRLIGEEDTDESTVEHQIVRVQVVRWSAIEGMWRAI